MKDKVCRAANYAAWLYRTTRDNRRVQDYLKTLPFEVPKEKVDTAIDRQVNLEQKRRPVTYDLELALLDRDPAKLFLDGLINRKEDLLGRFAGWQKFLCMYIRTLASVFLQIGRSETLSVDFRIKSGRVRFREFPVADGASYTALKEKRSSHVRVSHSLVLDTLWALRSLNGPEMVLIPDGFPLICSGQDLEPAGHRPASVSQVLYLCRSLGYVLKPRVLFVARTDGFTAVAADRKLAADRLKRLVSRYDGRKIVETALARRSGMAEVLDYVAPFLLLSFCGLPAREGYVWLNGVRRALGLSLPFNWYDMIGLLEYPRGAVSGRKLLDYALEAKDLRLLETLLLLSFPAETFRSWWLRPF